MAPVHEKRFPHESDAYRTARDELLSAEIKLRNQLEDIAVLRRKLPLGGKLEEDYIFEEGTVDLTEQATVKQTCFSDLFAPARTAW